MDRLYRLRGGVSRDRSPHAPSPRTPSRPNSDHLPQLELTVQRLVDRSLSGLEERLLRALRPPPASAAPAQDNISPPSPAPVAAATAPAGATAGSETEVAAPSSAVQQPPLPEKIKQRILTGEYIDFDSLLPEALYPARYGASPSPRSLSAYRTTLPPRRATSSSRNKNPRPNDLSETSPRGWRPGTSTPRSLEQPTPHAPQNYWPTRQSSARQAPDSHRSCGCAMTSASVRVPRPTVQCAGTTRTTSFGSHSSTYSLTHPSQSSAKTSRRPCTYCGSLYHYPDNCPSHPFRTPRRRAGSPRAPQHNPPPTPPPDAVQRPPISQVPITSPLPHPCRDFNNGVCRRPVCRFRHT